THVVLWFVPDCQEYLVRQFFYIIGCARNLFIDQLLFGGGGRSAAASITPVTRRLPVNVRIHNRICLFSKSCLDRIGSERQRTVCAIHTPRADGVRTCVISHNVDTVADQILEVTKLKVRVVRLCARKRICWGAWIATGCRPSPGPTGIHKYC